MRTSRKKIRAAVIVLKLFQFLFRLCVIMETALLFCHRYFISTRLNFVKSFNLSCKGCNVRLQLPIAFLIWKLLPLHKIFFFLFYSPVEYPNSTTRTSRSKLITSIIAKTFKKQIYEPRRYKHKEVLK